MCVKRNLHSHFENVLPQMSSYIEKQFSELGWDLFDSIHTIENSRMDVLTVNEDNGLFELFYKDLNMTALKIELGLLKEPEPVVKNRDVLPENIYQLEDVTREEYEEEKRYYYDRDELMDSLHKVLRVAFHKNVLKEDTDLRTMFSSSFSYSDSRQIVLSIAICTFQKMLTEISALEFGDDPNGIWDMLFGSCPSCPTECDIPFKWPIHMESDFNSPFIGRLASLVRLEDRAEVLESGPVHNRIVVYNRILIMLSSNQISV